VLSLSSSEWSNLSHAYGPAGDIPALLKQLESYPSSTGGAELWDSLWSALCHQGDVYPASFAAVPHIVQILSAAPQCAVFNFFLLPAAVEVARVEKNVAIPAELYASYFEALSRLPVLAAAGFRAGQDQNLTQCALAAFAVGAGDIDFARLLIELERRDLAEVLEWYLSR
jgi:hypothetical protein